MSDSSGSSAGHELALAAITGFVEAVVRGPRALGRVLSRVLALAAWAIAPSLRRRVGERLARLRPGARSLDAFRAVAHTLVDTLWLARADEPTGRSMRLPRASRRVLAEAVAEGRGVVLCGLHLGAFERMGALLASRFPVRVVARESFDPRVTALYDRWRVPRGVRPIYRGDAGAPFAIVRALAKGEVVGFLIDLPGRAPHVEARVLGRPTRLAIGPARIALRRRSPVVFVWPAPRASGKGDEAVVRAVRLRTDDLGLDERSERVLLRRLALAAGRAARSAPEQWLSLFDAR